MLSTITQKHNSVTLSHSFDLRLPEWIRGCGADVVPEHGGDDAVGAAPVGSHGEHHDLSREDRRVREATVGGGTGKSELNIEIFQIESNNLLKKRCSFIDKII